MWDRVRGWSNGPQMKTPVRVRVKSPPAGQLRVFVQLLQMVITLPVRVPHINGGAFQGPTLGAAHRAAHKQRATIQIAFDIGADRVMRRRDVEGAKDRRLSGTSGQPMIDRINQHRYSQSIRE